MNRRDFFKLLLGFPFLITSHKFKIDNYKPIGYVDARIHQHNYYRVLDKHTGEDLTNERIVWADDRVGVYGRIKEGKRTNGELDIETIKREIILVENR